MKKAQAFKAQKLRQKIKSLPKVGSLLFFGLDQAEKKKTKSFKQVSEAEFSLKLHSCETIFKRSADMYVLGDAGTYFFDRAPAKGVEPWGLIEYNFGEPDTFFLLEADQ
jgi:hypothetical protein